MKAYISTRQGFMETEVPDTTNLNYKLIESDDELGVDTYINLTTKQQIYITKA